MERIATYHLMMASYKKEGDIMRKSKRLAIMLRHRELVQQGKLEVAYYLLQLLRERETILGTNDKSFEAELVVEKLGCYIHYPNHWYYVIAHDYAKA